MKIQTFRFVSVLTFYILGSLSGECAIARLLSPENGESVSQRTVLQGEFARLEESLAAGEASFSRGDFDKFKGNLKRGLNCVPAPVKFRWDGEGKFLLRISKNADFSNPLIYVVKDGRGVDVYNLEIGTCYYWRVENVSGVSQTRKFATKSETPRRIKIDGLTNVRDIGGVSVGGGFKVRQGAVFRGTEFDYRLKITPDGERVFLSELGIKTDIDLRGKYGGVRAVFEGDFHSARHGGRRACRDSLRRRVFGGVVADCGKDDARAYPSVQHRPHGVQVRPQMAQNRQKRGGARQGCRL